MTTEQAAGAGGGIDDRESGGKRLLSTKSVGSNLSLSGSRRRNASIANSAQAARH